MAKLEELTKEYLHWEAKKDEAEGKLDELKEEIIVLAREKKIKKIKSGGFQLLLITQSETRFPQIGVKGRGAVERIVKESGELDKVVVFDIITLGNLYDEGKLNKELMMKLKPFDKRERTTKLVVKKGKTTP